MPQTTESQDEIIIDGVRLRRAFHRQGRLWLWLGPLAAGLLLLLLAALVPRSYVGTTSVALQQSSGGGSALALLTGSTGGSSKRYLGVLKSRLLAAVVERHVHLSQLYGAKTFPTEEDAVEFLMKNVKPDDSTTDGLLYISVTLPGPPKLALHPSPTASQAESAAADAANAYALGLKEYFAVSDTDQGAVLLRDADKEERQARARYNAAQSQLQAFSSGLTRQDPRSVPLPVGVSSSGPTSSAGSSPLGPSVSGSVSSASPGAVDAATASSTLPGLYAELNQVQSQLSETQAVRATGQTLIGTQLQDLSKVPTDDPLLNDIRNRVAQDRTTYNTLSALYAPGSQNINLVTAKARLDFDQADYERQIEGVKQQLTTPDVRSAEQVRGLQAKQTKLLAQIKEAQRHLGISRQLSGEAGRLQAEVSIQLDVLKATLGEAARVRLDNASSLSRMSMIDTAVPPKSGEPGLSKLAAISIVLAILMFLLSVVRDYLRAAPRQSGSVPGSGGTNGMGILGSEDPSHAAVHQESFSKP